MKARRLLIVAMVVAMALVAAAGCSKKAVPDASTGPSGPSDAELAARQLEEAARIVMSEKVYFGFDRYDLTPESEAILDRKAQVLIANPKLKVLVEGHCDERGTQEYNLALGERRARAAYQYMVGRGVPASMLESLSFGKERPADPAHNEQAWALNRRDEFRAVW